MSILSTNYRCNSGVNTYINFSSVNVNPRTDAYGSRVTMAFRVKMSSASRMFGGSDDTWERRIYITIGTSTFSIGGAHLMRRKNGSTGSWFTVSSGTEKFLLRRQNVTSDYWDYSGEYFYELTFDIPYQTGTKDISVSVRTGGGATGHVPGAFGQTYPISGTVFCYSGIKPSSVLNLRVNSLTSISFYSEVSGQISLSFTWDAPSTAGTGGVKEYHIYQKINLGSYVFLVNRGTTRSYSFSPTLAYGETRYYIVYAINNYGSTISATTLTVHRQPFVPKGRMNVLIAAGSVKVGDAYVRISGSWKKATEVYVLTSTGWKRSIL
jgi:hypothetical protein